jgi:hypothetical protein
VLLPMRREALLIGEFRPPTMDAHRGREPGGSWKA